MCFSTQVFASFIVSVSCTFLSGGPVSLSFCWLTATSVHADSFQRVFTSKKVLQFGWMVFCVSTVCLVAGLGRGWAAGEEAAVWGNPAFTVSLLFRAVWFLLKRISLGAGQWWVGS